MTEIRFYHLELASTDQVLPQLVAKALQTGQNVLIKVMNDQELNRLSDHLWTFDPASFIPHGVPNDPHSKDHPVFLTTADENPNEAHILFTTNMAEYLEFNSYQMVCALFDGKNDKALSAARTLWKSLKDSSHILTYWQQGAKGWEKKA